MHKKRGYSRDIPIELVRDYKLFAIVCEGGKREPDYFKVFKRFSSKIAVDVIEEIVSDEEVETKNKHKSAPKWVLDRAIRYIDKVGLIDEDDLWFVMDVDKWKPEQLREIADHCKDHPNWHIVLSNPCFEVWLYLHKNAGIAASASNSCNDFKNEISSFEKGGYHPLKFIADMPNAVKNAKAFDKELKHFMPVHKATKLYQLGEAVLKVIGKKGFNDFVSKTLPLLHIEENEKIKSSKRIRK